MNDVVALIDLYSPNTLGLLTKDRPLASTTFLARYAFIDFALSNFSNSGIDNIGVLVKDHPNSINKHISNPNAYLSNPKTGFLSLFINEKGILNPIYNTDLNNIKGNDYFLYDDKIKYVVICDPSFVKKVDYRKILKEHKESGRLASLLYMHVENGNDYPLAQKFTIDSLGDIQKIYTSNDDRECEVSINVLVIDKAFLKELLSLSDSISVGYSIAELLTYCIKYVSKIHAIKYEGEVVLVNSLESYFKNSLEFVRRPELLMEFLNDPEWTFYTTTHNSRPVLYGPNSKVTSSIVANGAKIDGIVKNSIISRDVTIEEGAVVENCILFTHSVVKTGVHLKNVVCDKRVVFKSKEDVEGTEETPLYFPRGVNV